MSRPPRWLTWLAVVVVALMVVVVVLLVLAVGRLGVPSDLLGEVSVRSTS